MARLQLIASSQRARVTLGNEALHSFVSRLYDSPALRELPAMNVRAALWRTQLHLVRLLNMGVCALTSWRITGAVLLPASANSSRTLRQKCAFGKLFKTGLTK
jgi:hypothetical protein